MMWYCGLTATGLIPVGMQQQLYGHPKHIIKRFNKNKKSHQFTPHGKKLEENSR